MTCKKKYLADIKWQLVTNITIIIIMKPKLSEGRLDIISFTNAIKAKVGYIFGADSVNLVQALVGRSDGKIQGRERYPPSSLSFLKV